MAEQSGLPVDQTKATPAETNVPCSASNSSSTTIITTMTNFSGSNNSPRYVENQIAHEHMLDSIDTSSLRTEEDFPTCLQLDKSFEFPEFHSEDWDLHMFDSVNPAMEIPPQFDNSTHEVFSHQTQNLAHANAPMLVDSVTTDLCRVSIQNPSLDPLHVESHVSVETPQSGTHGSIEQQNQENRASIGSLPIENNVNLCYVQENNKGIIEDSNINVETSSIDMACHEKNVHGQEKQNDTSVVAGTVVSVTEPSADCKMEAVNIKVNTELDDGNDEESESDEDEDDTSKESESSSSSSESSSSSDKGEEEEDDDTSSLEDIVQHKRPEMNIESECEEGELKMSPSRGKKNVKKKGSAVVEEGSSEDDGELTESKNDMKNLSPVPKISVTLEPHHNTIPVGAVSSIMGLQVIVEGIEDQTPLSEGSILWITEQRLPLGIIDEIFGPVKKPFYIVRYNNTEEIPNGVVGGVHVSYVQEFADFVLNNPDLYSRGYDGLDENVSDSEVEFSDDEKEAEYKRSKVSMKRNASGRNVIDNENEWNLEMTEHGSLSKKSIRNGKKRENRRKKFQETMQTPNHNANSQQQHIFDHSPASSEMSSQSNEHWHSERRGKGFFLKKGQNNSHRRDNNRQFESNNGFRSARSQNSRFNRQEEGDRMSRIQGKTDHRPGPSREHEWSSNRSPDPKFDQVQGPTSVSQAVMHNQLQAKIPSSGNLQSKDASAPSNHSPVQNYCQLPNIATAVPAPNLPPQQCGVNSGQGWVAVQNAYQSGPYQPAGYQPSPTFCQFPPGQQVQVQTNFGGYAQAVQAMPLSSPVVGIPAQPIAYNQGFVPQGPTSAPSMMWGIAANATSSQLPAGNTDATWHYNPVQQQQVEENRQHQHHQRQNSPHFFKNRNSSHQRRRF